MRNILIVCLMIFSVAFASSVKLPHSIVCKVCREEYMRKHFGCFKCYANRRCEIPHKKENGKIYTAYRCQHGHTFWVELDKSN